MQKITIVLLNIILILSLYGCATIREKSIDKERQLFTVWKEQNKRQNQAMGERVYNKQFDLVFTAIITGLADIGLPIRNMERMSGYILAEGPLPISVEEETRICETMVQELNSVSPRRWNLTPGNAKHSATITILRVGNGQTKVKIRISVIDIRTTASTVYSAIYPPILEEEYKVVWRAIERQVFLDEHLDGMN